MSAARALLYCAGGGIGDSLVASVVARALRAKFARVDALTLPGHRETLERVPDIDEVLVDDGDDERALASTLATRGYVACVVTWATARTARVPHLAKIPVRVGQARRLYSWRFTHRVTVRSETGDTTSHWTDILLDYARTLGCDTDDHQYRFTPTAEDSASVTLSVADSRPSMGYVGTSASCASSKGGSISSSDYLILNPCNAEASKRGIWPVEGWAALASALHERYGIPVLVSGAPADVPIAEAIVGAALRRRAGCASADVAHGWAGVGQAQGDTGGDADISSVAGKLGIGGFGALARGARAFVGITTGSMHVAAAVGCPTVGIFPFQTDFPQRWAPLGPRTAIVRATYPCHPGDTKETCADYACIANLNVPRILAAVDSLLVAPAAFTGT